MSRLVVVSNRVATPSEKPAAPGGLAVAVEEALRESGGIWFGWSGETSENPRAEPDIVSRDGITYATIDLSPQDEEDFYNETANRTIWPLFHYMSDKMSFSWSHWQGYIRANNRFVERLRRLLKPGDRVWVHDYHLIPLAGMLRGTGFEGPIGFFLHIPFPQSEVLRTLPTHAELVRDLCQYDLVGFQTPRAVSAFHGYIADEAGGTIGDDGEVHAFGRTLQVHALPISIDVGAFERMARAAVRSPVFGRLRDSLGERSLIIGVDRLDYSKGLVERFDAYEHLLRSYPENWNRVTLMQIAPLSREEVPEYAEIRRELEGRSGRINGAFAEFDWVPIRYQTRTVMRRTLAGLLRHAHIGLVTPLRDGMNLVAKEFVAAQDPEEPGVLILSEFAGAAHELEAALIVNPRDVEAVAGAMQRALTMTLDERTERWRAMHETIARNDISHWRNRFMQLLGSVGEGG